VAIGITLPSPIGTSEQGGSLAQARWEIDLLTKAFAPAMMQMELHEKEEGLFAILCG
jgi:hypothetical protein